MKIFLVYGWREEVQIFIIVIIVFFFGEHKMSHIEGAFSVIYTQQNEEYSL
jgi:hypothetical protein